MSCFLVDVVNVKVLGGYRLGLQFKDDAQHEVDISKLVPFRGVFEPFQDENFFSKVTVNHDIETIYLENGAELSPTYLRKNIQQQK